jgi:O-acetylserine dependent cystathionine beta-synthase
MTTHTEPLDSVLEAVGETPLVRLQASPDEVPVFAKLESFNPGASIKDRLGEYMLRRMLERGDVDPGGTVIEPTAGNTGIGMAMAATQLDLAVTFVVPEKFSVEKQVLMRALGAEVVNTPTEEGMKRAIEHAGELAGETDNATVPQQFSNRLNAEAHEQTTGPEIREALDGAVGALVAGCGTAGTLMGTARHLREHVPALHVVAVEPEGSLLARTEGQSVEQSEYTIEGIGTTNLATNKLYDPELVDEVRQVSDRTAHAEMQRLASEEGQLVASSAAAASVAAQDVAERIRDGELDVAHERVVTIFPDSSERYLSKGVYGTFEEWAGEDDG